MSKPTIKNARPPIGFRYCPHLAFKVCYTISAPVNGVMSDWFICAQIWKLDIADVTEDYTNSIVSVNFELSSPLMLAVEA